MKIIDLLNKMVNGEPMPDYISYFDLVEQKLNTMMNSKSNIIHKLDIGALFLNSEVSGITNITINIKDGNFTYEDKDIPLIPDDELWYISGNKGIIEDAYTYSKISRDNAINHNFKVLKEKINQVVEEFNEYRKENDK